MEEGVCMYVVVCVIETDQVTVGLWSMFVFFQNAFLKISIS